MGISANGNPAACLGSDFYQVAAQVLTIRIRINLNCFIQLCCQIEHATPVGAQPKTKVIDAPSRMAQNLESRVSQGSKIAIGLVFFLAQSGMKAAQNHV